MKDGRNRNRWVASLLLALLMVVPAPAVAEEDQAPPERAPGEALGANLLEVSAEDGAIVSWQDEGEPLTHVRVLGVEPGTTGYTLSDPFGVDIFVGQRSRSDGSVEFWYRFLDPGVYTVKLERPGFDEVVTVFDTTGILADRTDPVGALGILAPVLGAVNLLPTAAADGPEYDEYRCMTTSGTSTNCPGSCSWRDVMVLQGTEKAWTPLLIVNAPAPGSAEASKRTKTVDAIYIAPWGWESTSSSSGSLSTKNGKSVGRFTEVAWGLYERRDYKWYCTSYESDGYTTKIIDDQPSGHRVTDTFDLSGPSRWTDADNLDHVHRDNATSVYFGGQFEETDLEVRTSDAADEHYVSSQVYHALNGMISFEVGWKSIAVGFEALRFEFSDTETASFRYEFPKGYRWYIDDLGEVTGGWAFCNVDEVRCPSE